MHFKFKLHTIRQFIDRLINNQAITQSTIERNRFSLFGDILDWMLAPLLIIWPILIAVLYAASQNVAQQPFDHNLETSVRVLASQIDYDHGQVSINLPLTALQILRADKDDTVYLQVYVQNQKQYLMGDTQLPRPNEDEIVPAGQVRFRNVIYDQQEIRVAYTHIYFDHPRGQKIVLVQVAETLQKRADLASQIIRGVIVPQIIMLPLTVLLVWLGLRKGIAPLRSLRKQLAQRQQDDTSQIPLDNTPDELRELIGDFNQLLTRQHDSIERQQRFVADASHQLRTPLAGLKTQAELALDEEDASQLKSSLQQIVTSSERAAHMISQLLNLAKSENNILQESDFTTVDLEAIARNVLRDLFAKAMHKQLDLGLEATGNAVIVKGHATLLYEMLMNLVDNAINYTPIHGIITIAITIQYPNVLLSVQDNGLGIAIHERNRIFERFYRVLGHQADGSGLGLAIVREIIQQHQGSISIRFNPDCTSVDRPGTCMDVLLPLYHAAQLTTHDLLDDF
jgi:two-component system sensor histidine kinase TctE